MFVAEIKMWTRRGYRDVRPFGCASRDDFERFRYCGCDEVDDDYETASDDSETLSPNTARRKIGTIRLFEIAGVDIVEVD